MAKQLFKSHVDIPIFSRLSRTDSIRLENICNEFGISKSEFIRNTVTNTLGTMTQAIDALKPGTGQALMSAKIAEKLLMRKIELLSDSA